MSIILDNFAVPRQGQVELHVNISINIKITAEEAQRQVNRWLMDEVSYLLGAERPTLSIGTHPVWRVPAWLGLPSLGRVGIVGQIEVDVETGEMQGLGERRAEIERYLDELKPHLPHRPHVACELPGEYLAHLNPAPRLLP
jgi:hypothetical protein